MPPPLPPVLTPPLPSPPVLTPPPPQTQEFSAAIAAITLALQGPGSAASSISGGSSAHSSLSGSSSVRPSASGRKPVLPEGGLLVAHGGGRGPARGQGLRGQGEDRSSKVMVPAAAQLAA